MYNWHNCPANVAHQLEVMTCICQRHLGEALVGLYLHGSLAMGCFTPGRSDIDLLLVTRRPLAPGFIRLLAETLLTISNRPSPIEISAVTLDDLHPWVYPVPFEYHYSEAWRRQTAQALEGGNWPHEITASTGSKPTDPDLAAHILTTRARGVPLVGLPASEVLPEVPRADFLDSILQDFEWGKERLGQNPAYIVLNACRVLAFLHDEWVRSKLEGGIWGAKHLPESYQPLAQAAAAAYSQGQDWDDASQYPLREFLDWAESEIARLVK